jgi:hypothetical protein
MPILETALPRTCDAATLQAESHLLVQPQPG